MKYSFHPKELNNWKARITERLVQLYINHDLIPKLKKEWFELIVWTNPPLPLSFVTSALVEGKEIDWESAFDKSVTSITRISSDGRAKKFLPRDLPEEERVFRIEQWKKDKEKEAKQIRKIVKLLFLEKGVFPDSKLYKKTLKLLSILDVATDGILFKLKKTGKMIVAKKAFSGVKDRFRETEISEKIPVVSGEIEVIEIKSDKAFMMPHQKEAYRKVVENGFLFRYFHVNIISLKENQFEIWENVIQNAEELEGLFTIRKGFHKT